MTSSRWATIPFIVPTNGIFILRFFTTFYTPSNVTDDVTVPVSAKRPYRRFAEPAPWTSGFPYKGGIEHRPSDFLVSRHQVAVRRQRDDWRRVPEPVGDRLHGHAAGQQR